MNALEQIKDFIDNTNDLFSAQTVAQKLDLSILIARRYLPKLYAEKNIKLVRIDNHTKFYISINNQEKAFVSIFDRIRIYVENCSDYFTAIKLANKLDLSSSVVRKNLSKLLSNGLIKVIDYDKSTKIYISRKYKNGCWSDDISIITSYSKFKNYICKLNQPFTANEITKKLGLKQSTARRHISKMLTEGYIKLIGMDYHEKVYISNNYQGKIPVVSNIDKIKNYIYNLNLPITAERISNEIGLNQNIVRYNMLILSKEGIIRYLRKDKNKKVYMVNLNKEIIPEIMSNYNRVKSIVTSQTESFTTKEIADEVELSSLTVREYLQLLVSESYIKEIGKVKNARVYIPINYQGNLTDIMSNLNKMKNYIFHANFPFTTKIISHELNISYKIVEKNIRVLREDNYIKQIGIENRFKVYISNTYQGFMPVPNDNYNKIKRYIYTLGKPFTIKKVISELGIVYHVVKYNSSKLIKEGYIKFIGRDKMTKVYILNRHYGKESIKKR